MSAIDELSQEDRSIYLTGAILLTWGSLYEAIWQAIKSIQTLHRHRYNRYLFAHIRESNFTSISPPITEPEDFHEDVGDLVDQKIRFLRKMILSVDPGKSVRAYDKLRQEIERLYKIRNDFAHTTLRLWHGTEIVLVGHEVQRKAKAEMFPKNLHEKDNWQGLPIRSPEERRQLHLRMRGEIHYSFAEAESAIAQMAVAEKTLRDLINGLSWEGEILSPVKPK